MNKLNSILTALLLTAVLSACSQSTEETTGGDSSNPGATSPMASPGKTGGSASK
jgi:hypothetical protein